jgi:LacI family transcriptional regulator
MSDKVTVYQIAEKLEISASTVSRVLNNSSLISGKKSELILKTAEEMGYQKRNVRRPGSRAILNILLFIPYSKEPQYHLFYDSAQLIEGIRTGFGETKINIITELDNGSPTALKNRKVGDIDGAIFAFSDPSLSMVTFLNRRKIPFVLLNREDHRYNFVCLDNSAAMEKLFSLNERENLKPFYIGLQGAMKVNEYRKSAFLEQCERRKLTSYDILEISSFSEINQILLSTIRERQSNWIVCFNDIVAVSFIALALSNGIAIPGDMTVTGSDNSPLRNIYSIKVDTIDLAVKTMGKEAGLWLYRWIIEKKHTPLELLMPPKHIQGNTIS